MIGICLFFPYLGVEISEPLFFLYSVVLGFLLSSILERIDLVKHLSSIQKRFDVKDMMNENWDYNMMFYSLDKDDRDYLYLTGSYLSFFKITSNILIFYFFVNLSEIISNVTKDGFTSILTTQTQIIGGLEVNSLIISTITVFLVIFFIKDYIFEFEILFYPSGQYEAFAKKIQLKNTNIILIKSIWGRVIHNDKEIENLEIKLLENGVLLNSIMTDKNGFFQFKDEFKKNLSKTITVEYLVNNTIYSKSMTIDINVVPYFEFIQ